LRFEGDSPIPKYEECPILVLRGGEVSRADGKFDTFSSSAFVSFLEEGDAQKSVGEGGLESSVCTEVLDKLDVALGRPLEKERSELGPADRLKGTLGETGEPKNSCVRFPPET